MARCRVSYNRASLSSSVQAARKLAALGERPYIVFATYMGYEVVAYQGDAEGVLFQDFVKVLPNGVAADYRLSVRTGTHSCELHAV